VVVDGAVVDVSAAATGRAKKSQAELDFERLLALRFNDDSAKAAQAFVIELAEAGTPWADIENRLANAVHFGAAGPFADWLQALKFAHEEVAFQRGQKRWKVSAEADDDDAPTPINIFGDTTIAGQPDLPLDAVPKVLADAGQDEAERMGVDSAQIIVPMIVVCAAAIDDQYQLQPKRHDTRWRESPRLWAAIIQEIAGKKSPGQRVALEPVRHIEREWAIDDRALLEQYETEFKIYEKAFAKYLQDAANGKETVPPSKPIRPPRRRLLADDATIEAIAGLLADNPRGMLWAADELAHLFGSLGAYKPRGGSNKDEAALLELDNGGPRPVDRVKGCNHVENWSACDLPPVSLPVSA
jgi:hypothetical protein